MLTPAGAAAVAGVPVGTVSAWIREGRVIALPMQRGGHRLPQWQFAPAIWDALPQLSMALNSAVAWKLLSFLESPLGGLQGVTPRQAIEQGNLPRVLALALEEA